MYVRFGISSSKYKKYQPRESEKRTRNKIMKVIEVRVCSRKTTKGKRERKNIGEQGEKQQCNKDSDEV